MTRIFPHIRANARKLRQDATPQERKLWRPLREVNRMLGTHFRRQAAIGPFIADFADLGRKLVIEVDGGQHGKAADAARDAWFAGQGYRVLRFWNNEVDANLEGVMQVVLGAVEASSPSAPAPHPSPTRGEGGASPRRQSHRPSAASCASPPPRGEGMGEGSLSQDRRSEP